MQALLTKYVATDPTGAEHETYSDGDIYFAVFGKLKSHKTWLKIASAENELGAQQAVAHLTSTWRAGAEFVVVEVK